MKQTHYDGLPLNLQIPFFYGSEKTNHRNFFPSGQADLHCCGAIAVNYYGFIRRASHIDL
jgi:hypothetical protein